MSTELYETDFDGFVKVREKREEHKFEGVMMRAGGALNLTFLPEPSGKHRITRRPRDAMREPTRSSPWRLCVVFASFLVSALVHFTLSSFVHTYLLSIYVGEEL